MNEDEFMELMNDINKTLSNKQKLEIARALILNVADNVSDDKEKSKSLLVASELIRIMF